MNSMLSKQRDHISDVKLRAMSRFLPCAAESSRFARYGDKRLVLLVNFVLDKTTCKSKSHCIASISYGCPKANPDPLGFNRVVVTRDGSTVRMYFLYICTAVHQYCYMTSLLSSIQLELVNGEVISRSKIPQSSHDKKFTKQLRELGCIPLLDKE